jgi:hypothetical protein
MMIKEGNIYRSGSIRKRKLQRVLNTMPTYQYEFGMEYDLLNTRDEDKIIFWDRDVTPIVYEALVKSFATELARKMKFHDIKTLEKFDVNPALVVLNHDEYVKMMEDYEKQLIK